MTWDDEVWMQMAIIRAKSAATMGLRPFGCVIVDETGYVWGTGEGSETPTDPTRHSELVAIQRACFLKGGLLQGCALYSTHEPCTMCIGAIKHAKLSRVVWGSWRAALPELFRPQEHDTVLLLTDTTVEPTVRGGVLSRECITLFDGEMAALNA